MCRHYCFRANEETKVECTLIHAQNALVLQSRADLRGKSHEDGWGVSVYHDTVPEVERRATAAHEDLHFSTTVERVFSRAVVAHVRRATVGGPSLANTHPFIYKHWTFCHNGTVTGFEALREQLKHETLPRLRQYRLGTTDSEQVFYWLLSRMERAGLSLDEHCGDLDALRRVIAQSILLLAERCEEAGAAWPARLNCILTDGNVVLAARWNNTLHWILRRGIHDCEICGIPHIHHQAGVEYRAVIIASEPISHEQWLELPDRSIIAVDQSIRPEIRAVEALV